jgi:threonine/homoserine/homoserine lactone efflux protein
MTGMLLPLAVYGLVLGWSVAWPPGPINAEIMRRGLAQGFWHAYAVGLGASSGDAIWAIAVVLGAGALLGSTAAVGLLSLLSALLLLVLAASYLVGAWRGVVRWRTGSEAAMPGRLDNRRGGYLLGFGLALSSPFNIAFWLAALGRPEALRAGVPGALVVAGAVLVGTNLWVLLLCSGVVLLRLRFMSSTFEIVAKGASGLLMLAFAIDGLARFFA